MSSWTAPGGGKYVFSDRHCFGRPPPEFLADAEVLN
jgi:hypothetical protein